jgi:hypothetical protein
MRLTLDAIFEASSPEPNTGCWLWTRALDAHGYGSVWDPGTRKVVYAHRAAYEAANGPLAAGLCVCHRCDNPPCVKPAHLFSGTRGDNIRDMDRKGRRVNAPHIGEAHHKAVLTEEQVRTLRRERDAGMTLPQLRDKYGISKSAVCAIAQRRVWKHVA